MLAQFTPDPVALGALVIGIGGLVWLANEVGRLTDRWRGKPPESPTYATEKQVNELKSDVSALKEDLRDKYATSSQLHDLKIQFAEIRAKVDTLAADTRKSVHDFKDVQNQMGLKIEAMKAEHLRDMRAELKPLNDQIQGIARTLAVVQSSIHRGFNQPCPEGGCNTE